MFLLPCLDARREVRLDIAVVLQSVRFHHVFHLQLQPQSSSRLPRRPREQDLLQPPKLRRPQSLLQGGQQPRIRLVRRILQPRQQRRRVVVPQILRPDPERVKQHVAVARKSRVGPPRRTALRAAGLRRLRRHQVDDPPCGGPARVADVEHDGQHRREAVGGAEPPAAPVLHVEVVHVVADAQRHQIVHGGLELQHHHQVQPRPGGLGLRAFVAGRGSGPVRAPARRVRIVLATFAQIHPPHHVIAVAVQRRAGIADRLLVHAGEGGEVQRIDERVHAVAVGDEPVHQLLDHDGVGQDALVRGVGVHSGDATRGRRGGQRALGASGVGAGAERTGRRPTRGRVFGPSRRLLRGDILNSRERCAESINQEAT